MRKASSAIRGVLVTFGGQAALVTALLRAVRKALTARRREGRPGQATLATLALAVAYATWLRPRMRTWGCEGDDAIRTLPGDELVPDAGVQITHAITIEAPVERVWPWLAQIGQDRGGFYSYEWLENLAGCEMRNADRIHSEWQQRELGELVYLHPLNGLRVTMFEPGRLIGLEGWGVFMVEPVGEGGTRLIARGRVPRGFASWLYVALLEIPHFLMQRKMLLGIKERATAQPSPPWEGAHDGDARPQ